MSAPTRTTTGMTPGPWRIFKKSEVFNGADVIVSDHVDDAIVCSIGGDMAEADANARAIAKLPELVEALRRAIGSMEAATNCTFEVLPQLRTLLAQIDGKGSV